MAAQATVNAAAPSSQGTTTVVEAPADPVSYQGRLSAGGAPANGSYDFQFLLKDAATAGNTLGDVLKMSLPVQSGVFSASLAWKPSLFNGSARWIEVRVRPTPAAGASTSETDAPYAVLERQRIQSAPHAFRAGTAATVESVPVTSLPSSVPLKGADGKLDSSLLASDIARSSKLDALAQDVAALKQWVQILAAPARSGWMVASTKSADQDLISAGFSLVSSTPAPGWIPITASGAPSPRSAAASVWTGQEWIIWGGAVFGIPFGSGSGSATATQIPTATGAKYRPDANTWTEVTSLDAPEARSGHTAVWTGTQMIVWGGFSNKLLNNGGRYTSSPQSWAPMSVVGAPSARSGHGAVWTGRSMVVFGGRNTSGLLADGGIYDPTNDSWTTLPTQGAPAARNRPTVIWTGTSLLVWGGEVSEGDAASGAVLSFDATGKPLSWSAMPQLDGLGRSGHASAWDGKRLIIWGGRARSGALLATGAVWDSTTSKWTPMSTDGAPEARLDASSAWTGDEFVVFGGSNNQGVLASGGAWNAASGTWRPLPSQPITGARGRAVSALAGVQWMVFGGVNSNGAGLADPQWIELRPPWNFYRRGALPSESLPISSP